MLPPRVLYYGKDEPLPERIPLRAGPLTLVYEDGDLRTIKLGEVEVLRRIYVAVRDQNWGTILPRLSNVQMDVRADSFDITYDIENRRGNIHFSWRGTLSGAPDGTVRFVMDGQAHTAFLKNRIGFCVLHPSACAGAAAIVEHVDGTTERAVLPELIVPDQPVQPFANLRAISHEVTPGVWAQVRMEGDTFELEDQRNWTDASYKTYCTPLSLPFPVPIEAGTRVRQSITLTLKGELAAQWDKPVSLRTQFAERTGSSNLVLSLDRAAPARSLPTLGLGVASHSQPLSTREIERLKALRLHHLRVDLLLSDSTYPDALRRATTRANELGVPLEIALLLSDAAEQELAALERVMSELQASRPQGFINPWGLPLQSVDLWLVYPVKEGYKGGSPTAQLVQLARRYLIHYGANFAAGTNTDFIFLQRNPPPVELLDAVTLAINPQPHAVDNASVVETLGAQAAVIYTARRLAGNLPLVVSPVTLKPRFNPYVTGALPPTPPGELPPQVDVRQMSLFGAGWTLGSFKYLAESGVSRVTFYETTGWRGVMEAESGSPVPDKFRSLPGAVFPVYFTLAALGEFAGGEVIPVRSSDPLTVEGLALHLGARTRILAANLTDQPQRVTLGLEMAGLQEPVFLRTPFAEKTGSLQSLRVRILDETNAEAAMCSPESFISESGERAATEAGKLMLELRPYAVAQVDID